MVSATQILILLSSFIYIAYALPHPSTGTENDQHFLLQRDDHGGNGVLDVVGRKKRSHLFGVHEFQIDAPPDHYIDDPMSGGVPPMMDDPAHDGPEMEDMIDTDMAPDPEALSLVYGDEMDMADGDYNY